MSTRSNYEVEDIMCDQVIISAELNVGKYFSALAIPTTKVRIVVSLLARAVLPTIINIFYAYIKHKNYIFENYCHQLIPCICTFLTTYASRPFQTNRIQAKFDEVNSDNYYNHDPDDDDADDATNEVGKSRFVECNVLNEPKGPVQADVIFIHGLHGSLEKTWRQGDWRHKNHKMYRRESVRLWSNGLLDNLSKSIAEEGSKNICDTNENFLNDTMNPDECNKSNCWPKEWIPEDCPNVRVIALNYTTDPHLWRPLWVKKEYRSSMSERSKEMMEELIKVGVGSYPIIWVGHSKGGLFIKQILVESWFNKVNEMMGNFYLKTEAILFYSVPHRGSYLADVAVPLFRRSIELLEIQRNCETVLTLHENFLKIFDDERFSPKVFSFIETSLTFMSFIYLKIVTLDSADPGIGFRCGIPLDHREICKPSGKNCFLYTTFLEVINDALNVYR